MTPTEKVELLTKEYEAWCADAEQEFKCMDVLELIHDKGYELTPEQSTWIYDFLKRWEGMWNDFDSQYNSSHLPSYETRWSTTLESAKRVKEAMK